MREPLIAHTSAQGRKAGFRPAGAGMGWASIQGGVEGGVAGSPGVGRSKGRVSPEGGARGVGLGLPRPAEPGVGG